jgi:hypothetical protein
MTRRSRSFLRTSIPLIKHVSLVNYTSLSGNMVLFALAFAVVFGLCALFL